MVAAVYGVMAVLHWREASGVGRVAATGALLIAFVSYTPAHIARGIASGHGRFRAYAVVMSADGVVRISDLATGMARGVVALSLGTLMPRGPLRRVTVEAAR